jgi:ribosomal protein S18 acetylase RimI-like enzyme
MRNAAGGGSRLRVRPWQADARIAHVAPAADYLGPLTATDVERAVDQLCAQGYRSVITSALHRADRRPFVAVGFQETERLHLLLHPFDDIVPPPPVAGVDLRRGRRRDHDDVLAVDRAAFSPFWRLDPAGLDEALTATSTVHFQVARTPDHIVGYSVCGRAGHRGYVQRLAVDPGAQGRGVGAGLLTDGLRWLRRWGARDALVNTQEGNARSLRLYQRSGFHLQPEGLAVLQLDLAPAAPVVAATAPAGARTGTRAGNGTGGALSDEQHGRAHGGRLGRRGERP